MEGYKDEIIGEETDESLEAAKAQRMSAINSLTEQLIHVKRKEAIEARAASGVERRWYEDEQAYDGLDWSVRRRNMIDYATGEATARDLVEPKRSKVIMNITRSKTEIAEGRFSDIQLPLDDRNWGLKPTPLPELIDDLENNKPAFQGGRPVTDSDTGEQVAVADVAKDRMAIAQKKMAAMETEIDDQLNECSFNAECRKAIYQATKLGTGVIKGPGVVKNTRKSWRKESDGAGNSAYVVILAEDNVPASKWIDCWKFYPDPRCGNDIRRAGYTWERDTILPRDVKDLIGVEGYLTDQLIEVLKEDPKRTKVIEGRKSRYMSTTDTVSRGEFYEMWEYNGDMNTDDLIALGCECVMEEYEMLMKKVSACIVFINDRPVKVELNVLDTGDIPYDVFQWVPNEDEIWGVGIPRMMMWEQRVITAAWRRMMDNAGDSSGVNVVMSKEVEPADGIWELTGKKLWEAVEDNVDVSKAFAQFQVANTQPELQAIIDLTLRFVDLATNMPTLFQGEAKQAPETFGATQIMVDANNVATRHRVKRWDDQITRPHLTRYYHWNMQYNDNDEAKGDYKVDPRGTRILTEKDQQAKSILELWNLKNDPDMKDMIDWEKMARRLLASQHLDVILPEEVIKQNKKAREEQPPPVDPNIQSAQLRVEGDLKKEEMRSANLEAERQHAKEMKQVDREIQVMKLAQDQNISIESIKAQLAVTAAKLKTQKDISLSSGNKKGQVIKPEIEPAGKAPAGEAFQR